MNDESPVWGAWLVAASVLICCGGPFLVAALGAGGLSLVAAWLQPYRVPLLTAAGVLFAVGAYQNRSGLKPCCEVTDVRATSISRVLALLMWTVAALALVGALLSIVSGRR